LFFGHPTVMKVSVFKTALFILGMPLMTWAEAPSDWANTWKASDGTIWSDLLPGVYSNCISVKDQAGDPVLDSEGFVVCEADSQGGLAGDSSDGLSIVDSDAVRACQAVGGLLPSEEDFNILGADFSKLPNMADHWYWSTLVYFPNPVGGEGLIGNQGNLALVYRKDLGSVRCVSPATAN
jgi:hypothetical protein